MDFREIRFSRHAVQRMFERSISVEDVFELVRIGEQIEDYPDDTPWPARLLMARVGMRVLHAVVAESEPGICYVITVYEPDPARWQPGFRKRRVP